MMSRIPWHLFALLGALAMFVVTTASLKEETRTSKIVLVGPFKKN